MGEFEVLFTKSADKDLEDLIPQIRLQILQDVKTLESSPLPRGTTIKRLKGFQVPLYRLRSGDYRLVYSIDNKTIVVLLVVDRKDLERRLKAIR